MSQNAQSLLTVEKASGLKGRLVRPLSAKFLEPTIPELEGKLDREKLLDISGRARDRQIALAAEFGIVDYPSPAGGCKLTEEAFGHRLRDLMEHEGFGDRSLIELLSVGRRFRLPDGSSVILGRDAKENARLAKCAGTVIAFDDVPGPTAVVPVVKSEADLERARKIVRAWSRGTTEADRAPFKAWQLT
jgi:tRNA-uridine 2-sulfurtransferase